MIIRLKKNFYVTLFLLLLPLSIYAQKVIEMENVNGVYRIACSVNGAKMKMIFDTGASTVSISQTMANFLYENNYISSEDILGQGASQTADGSIVNNVVINLRDVEISGLHLKDVKATVLDSQNAPLLLGQTAIQKLGKISLDGNKLIINDYESDYSDEEIEQIANQAVEYFSEGKDYASIDNWLKVIDYIDLTTEGYFMLISSFYRTKQYKKCIEYGKEWERKYRNEEPSDLSCAILSTLATTLDVEEGNTKEAIIYLEKVVSQEEKLNSKDALALDYCRLNNSYWYIEDWDNVISLSKKILKILFDYYKTSESEIKNKGIDNETIGLCLYDYADAFIHKSNVVKGYYIMGLSAKCNYKDAIEYCLKHNINYNSKQSLFD